jgi:cystathionine beta-lyase/cystathionine gamma-synthase
MRRCGIETSHVDVNDPAERDRALRPATRLLYLESPTNPLMEIIDLRSAAAWGRAHGLRVAVDNTFLTPYYQRPLELGADLVIHSTTKYLNGHSDSIGGAVIAARPEDADQLRFLQKAAGAILGPFDSWLVLRGIKTLAVRMRQHSENALAVAQWLRGQAKVKRVYYPGLPDHPQRALAETQMSGFGGMVSFDLGSLDAARSFFRALKLIPLAESLGGVESLVAHPATMSHAYLSAEERAAMGIGDGLVRLSVGIEDADDLIADLAGALK